MVLWGFWPCYTVPITLWWLLMANIALQNHQTSPLKKKMVMALYMGHIHRILHRYVRFREGHWRTPPFYPILGIPIWDTFAVEIWNGIPQATKVATKIMKIVWLVPYLPSHPVLSTGIVGGEKPTPIQSQFWPGVLRPQNTSFFRIWSVSLLKQQFYWYPLVN